jgi:imidazolonepropionase-like amidohydrolase
MNMYGKSLLLCGVLLAAMASNIILAAEGEQSTIIHAGSLLSVPGQRPLSNQSVVITNGRITAVRNGFVSGEDIGDPDAEIIDLRDKFVLPGMIDMHVHLTANAGPRPDFARTSEADLAMTAVGNARKTLMAGITTVRDVGSASAQAIVAVSKAINSGITPGPRVFPAGRSISATAGHGDPRGLEEDIAELVLPTSVCDGVAECRKAVRNQYKVGAKVIKLHATGGGGDQNGQPDSPQEMFDDELLAIVETAHQLNMKVAAHAHGAPGIQAALRAGVDSIEHASWIDDKTIDLYSKTDTYLVPTLYLYDYFLVSPTISEFARNKSRTKGPGILANMAKAYKKGVVFAMGTDSGISPHGENAGELLQYVEIGMSPMEAIETTTINAAALLDQKSNLGTLEEGKLADIIATDNSPLDDIAELQNVTFVMKDGITFKHE